MQRIQPGALHTNGDSKSYAQPNIYSSLKRYAQPNRNSKRNCHGKPHRDSDYYGDSNLHRDKYTDNHALPGDRSRL